MLIISIWMFIVKIIAACSDNLQNNQDSYEEAVHTVTFNAKYSLENIIVEEREVCCTYNLVANITKLEFFVDWDQVMPSEQGETTLNVIVKSPIDEDAIEFLTPFSICSFCIKVLLCSSKLNKYLDDNSPINSPKYVTIPGSSDYNDTFLVFLKGSNNLMRLVVAVEKCTEKRYIIYTEDLKNFRKLVFVHIKSGNGGIDYEIPSGVNINYHIDIDHFEQIENVYENLSLLIPDNLRYIQDASCGHLNS